MKITILRTNTADFGKIGNYNVQEVGLANALIKKGHQVNVLFLNRKVSDIQKDDKYNFVHYLPSLSFGLHGIFNTKLLNLFEPDKMILFSDNQLWAKNVIKWCQKNNVTCIQYMGNVLSDNPKWINQFYTKLILKRNRNSYKNSINVGKTNKVKKEMETHNISCSSVINVGLDKDLLHDFINPVDSIRKKMGFNEDEIILLYIGRIVDYKKPFLACDILQSLIDKGVNCRMIMIGKGPLESELKKYISQKKLLNEITYFEQVPNSEIYKYMITSDCFINLSSKEIFGMAILESMYYGLPVVAHVAPGPNEVITDSQDGYLCGTDDPREWSKMILEAIKNKNDISYASRNTILNFYTWDVIANKFIDLF